MKHLYVIFIVPSTLLIPLLAGTWKGVYRQAALRMIYAYLLFAVLIEIASRVLGSRGINNLPLLHFYTIIEFLLLMRFFMLADAGRHQVKLIGWLMAVFTLYSIFNFSFIESLHRFNSYPRTLSALIIAGFCLHYFYSRIVGDPQGSWTANPLNWIVTGLLIYFGSSFFHFAFQNILYQKASLAVNYFFAYVHATLVMVMYFLFTIGFYYVRRQR